jgi:hypothetical protein
VLLHVGLQDSTAQRQQDAIGILGVNLIYAACHQTAGMDIFLAGLFDELSMARIEIDMIELDGPAFAGQDGHEWCLALVGLEMAHAVVFDAGGQVGEPSSVLRKRPLLVMRGTFSHPEFVDPGLFQAAKRQLLAEGAPIEREPLPLIEMTTHHISRAETFDVRQMLACVRQLSPSGCVMVSDYPETYLLGSYLRRYSTEPLRYILSVAASAKTLHTASYQGLPGTLLEGLGRLLATNVKLYVAAMPTEAFRDAAGDVSDTLVVRDSGKGLVSLDDLAPSEPVVHLFQYLRATGRIVALEQG